MKNDEFKKEYDLLEEEFELAREIIKLRTKASLTQKQLAELAGTSLPAIARLESGSYNNVSLAFLRRIGKALNVTPEIHFKKNKNN
ncbi:MAG: helix-turn-helix domain-containing protein [Spirochaetes bacterium]|nr:helix-turn-helix domain-containing protein [Spirochaetota bacterium]MBP9022377.1 helix-turn-helix domain-containing protein [Spirochaetota bacterium]